MKKKKQRERENICKVTSYWRGRKERRTYDSLLNYLRCAVIMWLLIRKNKCITYKEKEPFVHLGRFDQSRNELINLVQMTLGGHNETGCHV